MKKAMHHHAKAGAALKMGDRKTALHHVGHMMKALQHAEPDADEQGGMPDQDADDAPMSFMQKARMRFGKKA